MAKFKVGDRVRRIKNDNGTKVKVGDIGCVVSLAANGVLVRAEKDGEVHYHLGYYLERVPSGPARTVTRREIVPGVYGTVTVERIPFQGFEITHKSYGNAFKLREAARIFNEIADVLEENAGVKEAA